MQKNNRALANVTAFEENLANTIFSVLNEYI